MSKKEVKDLPKIESIDEMLEKYGLNNNEFVRGIKNRYIMQLTIINRLYEEIQKSSMTVEKKRDGAYGLYANPLLTEINKHIATANNTATTLTNTIEKIGKLQEAEKKTEKKVSPLAEMLSD